MSAINTGTLELIRNRRSIRTYTQQPVDREIIEQIVDAARFAPTAMNNQPWEFVILTDRELLKSIPSILGHAEFIANAAFCVLVLGYRLDYAVEDCCSATQNMILAGEAFKLGSCWVAGTGQAYSTVICKTFGVPDNLQLINIVAFGYPAESPTMQKRPLTEMLHWDRF